MLVQSVALKAAVLPGVGIAACPGPWPKTGQKNF